MSNTIYKKFKFKHSFEVFVIYFLIIQEQSQTIFKYYFSMSQNVLMVVLVRFLILGHKSSFVLCFNQKQHSHHFPLTAIFKLAQLISTLLVILLQFLYIPQQLVYQSSSSTNYNNQIPALLSHLVGLNMNISTIIYFIFIIFLVTLLLYYRERFKSIIIGLASNLVLNISVHRITSKHRINNGNNNVSAVYLISIKHMVSVQLNIQNNELLLLYSFF